MFRFGNTQKVSGKLDQMLDKPNLTVQQLFSIENIIGDIKQKVEVFVEYCKKHKQFTFRVIQLALNTSIEQLQQQNLKEVAFVATQFLSCDQDGLGQLFFEQKDEQKQAKKSEGEQGLKNQSQISQRIEQVDPDNIDENKNQDQDVTTVDRVSQSQQKVIDSAQKKAEDTKSHQEQEKPIFEKYELVKQSLKILENPMRNQTCLGYISKLYSFLIRRESNAPMQFFSTHKQYTELLLTNIHYDSIANLLAQMVACEDTKRLYKYEEFKKGLFKSIIDIMLGRIDEQTTFQGVIVFVEQVLNNTKQSYYQYFEDFKRCANVLVSQEELERVFNILKNSSQGALPNDLTTFKNATTYLHMIAKRINAENEDTDYYENTDKKQPTMNFEIDFLYKNIDEIIMIISKIEKQGLIAKNLYLNLIVELMKSLKFKDFPFSFINNITVQLKCLKNWQSKGIIKNSLFQIVDLSISRAQTQQVVQLFEKHGDMLRQYFGFLSENTAPQTTEQKQDRAVSQLRENNKKQEICYFFKTFFMLKSRESQKIIQFSNILGIKVSETEKRYETKLAAPKNPLKQSSEFRLFSKSELQNSRQSNKEQQNQSPNEQVIEQSPVVFNFNNDKQSNIFGQSFANRANIFIPHLNIPHLGSSGKDSPPCLEPVSEKKQSDIIIDLDTEGVIIEHEEVQRLVINSPRSRNLIGGFMGTSSPRGLNLSGFKSDRSSQGNNSARSGQEQSSKINTDKVKQESKQEKPQEQKPRVIRNFCQEEVTFFVRYAILI